MPQFVATYVTGVDKPGDVSERSQFSVHKAANFAVFPAIVDVNKSDHVPLQQQKETHSLWKICYCTSGA